MHESLRRHHPDAELTALVIDAADEMQHSPSGARLLSPGALDLPTDLFPKLAMACTAPELADALMPRLVRSLVEHGASVVVVLGAETEVFAPIDEVVELARAHGVVLVPRVDSPLTDDGLEPDATQLREAGPFASELVAVSADSAPLVDWWCDRQTEAALGAGGFEQSGSWTAQVPAMFACHVLRDPGYGVSAWNLHARDLRATDHEYVVSGRQLRTADFAGYSPDVPQLLSTDFERPRVRLGDHPALARLCDEHGARLRAAGYEARTLGYGYDTLPDGREIDGRMRRMYVDALRDTEERGEPEPPSPFAPEGVDAFVAWINEPVAPSTDPRVSRYLTRVWQEDETLQQVFPSLAGEGAEQYAGSLREAGAADRGIPEWVLPREPQLHELMKRRWRSRPSGPRPRGVNVVGYVTAVLGVGEVGRVVASALDDAGVPKVVVANQETSSQTSLSFETSSGSDAPYDLNLLCVNADHTVALAQQLGPEFFAGRRTIGVWFWELEDFPSPMTEAFPLVDEVWVASDFVLEAIAAVSPKSVRKFPLPVVVPTVPEGIPRSALGLPDDRFVFLFVFDFLSTAERKNPVGLISAYTHAFGPDDGTVLVLKSINGEKRVPQAERVRRAAAGRPDVIMLDAYLSPEQHTALVDHCDAYVSLHRSEGFGLDMAKAMGLGKPVIATGYSGNLEFMDDDVGYLVGFDLEPVGPGCEPYPSNSRWARPRLDHAAELMRRVVERPDEARELGRRAAERIRGQFSMDARSSALARMVNDARARGAPQGSWRHFFMEGWRARRDRVADLPYGALDWLPDGALVDKTLRRVLTEDSAGTAPDPEGDLPGFYRWLNELVYPPRTPIVSRYLYNLWRDRPDLQAHFPDLVADPRAYLAFLVDRGHDDTDIPHQLLPADEDVRRAARYQTWRERRDRLNHAIRSAGQRAAGLVNRR